MDDWKDRLIKERDDLKEKIQNLEYFLQTNESFNISEIQYSLLNVQLAIMRSYSDCLTLRIHNL